MESLQRSSNAAPSPSSKDRPSLQYRGRSSPVKNRMLESACAGGNILTYSANHCRTSPHLGRAVIDSILTLARSKSRSAAGLAPRYAFESDALQAVMTASVFKAMLSGAAGTPGKVTRVLAGHLNCKPYTKLRLRRWGSPQADESRPV
jgi:hypothetical protein